MLVLKRPISLSKIFGSSYIELKTCQFLKHRDSTQRRIEKSIYIRGVYKRKNFILDKQEILRNIEDSFLRNSFHFFHFWMQTSSIPEFISINNRFKKLFLTLSAILSKLVGIFQKKNYRRIVAVRKTKQFLQKQNMDCSVGGYFVYK